MPSTAELPPEAQANRDHITLNLCAHTFPSGSVCGSPALRGESFCYYHHPTRKKVRNPHERLSRRAARQRFSLGAPTNPTELHIALNEIIIRLAANDIDTRRAGLLLTALQIAGKNFTHTPASGDPLQSLLHLLRE